jgi:3-hydroxybutyryl-CoA dehydrogenase
MAIKQVGILGLGTMGHGIAIVTAQAGYDVIALEANEEFLKAGLERVNQYFERAIKKGRMDEAEGQAAMSRVTGALNASQLADCDLLIEAVTEDIAIKSELYTIFSDICKPETIFVSNTSSLSVTQMATASGRPAQFAGLHFFNPVPVMKLVEVIHAVQTSDEIYEIVFAFVETLGKKAVRANDTPGFIVNRLLVPYLIDAARVYEQGLASAEDIDNAMKLGAGHPMGPLALIDLIGLDVAMWVGEILFAEIGEARFAPPPILRRMVRAGYLGKKTGKGFYDYSGNGG